jgi:hypothetical protein
MTSSARGSNCHDLPTAWRAVCGQAYPTMEHRWGRRKSTDVAVRFVATPATIGTGKIVNISLTGAFLETRAQLRLLSLVHLELSGAVSGGDQASGGDQENLLVASVVRQTPLGVGLEWCDSAVSAAAYARLNAVPRQQAASVVPLSPAPEALRCAVPSPPTVPHQIGR